MLLCIITLIMKRSWSHLHIPAQEMSKYVLDKICQRGRLLVLSLLSFKRLAKILLKHKHLDNQGKLELLHMMSNTMSRNQIELQNAQGQIKCQVKNWSCRNPRCRIQCPGHLARKYWTHKSVISLADWCAFSKRIGALSLRNELKIIKDWITNLNSFVQDLKIKDKN